MTEPRPASEPRAAVAASEPAPPSMTLWGRRAARWYLLVGLLALIAMLVETVLGHAGIGTMFAAVLAAPWSMLVAGMAPPLPRDWPMAAGLAARMVPLALFMLLNALIVASIAARSERDLKSGVSKPLVLVLLAGLLSSGCGLTSKQVVLVAVPTAEAQFFTAQAVYTLLEFDLATVKAWSENRGHISEVGDLTLMGEFRNPNDGPFQPPAPVDIEIAMSSTQFSVDEPALWAGPHLEPGARAGVSWDEGHRRMLDRTPALQNELRGDGRFTIVVRGVAPPGAASFMSVTNLRLGAVLYVK